MREMQGSLGETLDICSDYPGVLQYNANWVRNQSRMTSTSNQETWRADIEGRIVFDLLRQVPTKPFRRHCRRSDCNSVL